LVDGHQSWFIIGFNEIAPLNHEIARASVDRGTDETVSHHYSGIIYRRPVGTYRLGKCLGI